MSLLPTYPIFVPSKDRYQANRALTVRWLLRDGVPFRLVCEPSQAEEYAKVVGDERILETPRDDMKLLGTRNYIRDVAEAEGHEKHWQIDDNVAEIYRVWRGERLHCLAGPAFRVIDDFTDRYENIGVAGMNYMTFVRKGLPPFYLNVHVYSITQINHAMPCRWRLVYNDDTDICLQALSSGWCTVLVNAFCGDKAATMSLHGGNTNQLYEGDGRLKMSRALERKWPGVVSTDRRYRRPQHVVRNQWRGFDTPLKLKEGVDLDALREQQNEYGLKLEVLNEPKAWQLKRLVDDAKGD